MNKNYFQLCGAFFCATAFAGTTTITTIKATFSGGTQVIEEGEKAETETRYVVISKENANEQPSRIAKVNYTLVSIRPDDQFPHNSIAKTSKVLLVSYPGPTDVPIPSTLSGVLPSGESFKVELSPATNTLEVKPEGTLVATYCGQPEPAIRIPEEPYLDTVCIEVADAVEVK